MGIQEQMRLTVLGLGYVGLPTALAFARGGTPTTGVDIDSDLLAQLRDDRCPITELKIPAWLHEALEKGTFHLAITPAPSDVFIICVPTPFDPATRVADLRAVESAARSIVPVLRRGNLVILESTVPVGTTEDVVAPILEASGLKTTEDFSLAFCPERILPGNIAHELVHNDRIVGGDTEATRKRLSDLYGRIVKGRIYETSIRTAEFVKLVENTYRAVNIGLSNELLLLAQRMGVDVWEAIALANRHPRVSILSPGPGVGGHCIPVDPWFLIQDAPFGKEGVVRSALERNEGMTWAVLKRVQDLLEEQGRPLKGAKVALLGAAYKGGTEDARESPTERLYEGLIAHGAQVRVYDPLVTRFPAPVERELRPLLDWCDVAVAMVDHKEIGELDWGTILPKAGGPLVLDARGMYRAHPHPNVRGFGY